ncbi:carboxypeptidase regulatory-like domain-containing protein [Vibrio vulnificus]|nr:carboxypeptidase-like regulatory domain-containing protein [Vibrio vulnificus]EME0157735.1 carboxypeptidase-like regulatory domain-containing protein [Vibrio vulnificus]
MERVYGFSRQQYSVLLRVLYILLLMVPFKTFAAVDIDKGYQWILSQYQSSDAVLVENSVATDFVAIQESLVLLKDKDLLPQQVTDKVIDKLAQYSLWDTESIQRFLSLKTSHETNNALLQALLLHQTADGGFSGLPGHDANALDTAFALLILKDVPNLDKRVISRAIYFLTQLEQSDGSYRLNSSNESSIYLSALVSQALQGYLFDYQVGPFIERANQYLLNQQFIDAGWGEAWLTAHALQAVIPMVTDNTTYGESLSWLASRQRENGSWEGDLYTTALALHVFHLSSIPPKTSPTASRISGAITSSATNQPITGVSVEVLGPESYSTTTQSDGRFDIVDVEPGSYTLTYSAQGYLEAMQSIVVTRGNMLNLGTIALRAVPTQGLLSGLVVDGETGLPLSGAQIVVTGQGSATTNAQGKYQLAVSEPSVAITVSAQGYQSIEANGSVPLGQHVVFSPALYQQPSVGNTVTITGRVLDKESGLPIVGVLVAGAGSSVITDINGEYAIQSEETSVTLSFSAAGYVAAQNSYIGALGTSVQTGDYYLAPEIVDIETTVSGMVVDDATGTPIPGAVVALSAASLEVVTNNQGKFYLTGITVDEFTLFARANGYLSQSVQINAAEPTQLTVNFSLSSASQLGVDIADMQTNQASVEAYQHIELNFAVKNSGNEAKNILILTEVLDSQGEVVKQLALGSATGQVNADVLQTLLPDQQESYSASWFSGITLPGQYTYRVRVFDGLSSTVLAQRSYPFTITESRSIERLSVIPIPQFSYVGKHVDLSFIGTLENRSNVPLEVSLGYVLQAPNSGDVVLSGEINATIEPETVSFTLPLTAQEYQFLEKGDYSVHIAIHSEIEPKLVITKPVVVSPTTRLNLTQDLSPERVVPNGNQRVHIKINLEGVE